MKTEMINFRLPSDLASALKRAAADDLRSTHSQGILYIRQALIAEGRYQPDSPSRAMREAGPTRARAVGTVDRQSALAVPIGLPRPSTRAEPPSGVRLGAIIAAIGVEVRAEQNRPLGKNQILLRLMIEQKFPGVTDLSSARAIGLDAWVAAGARPGLIGVLFPGDRAAVEAAKKAQNRAQMDRQIAAGSDNKRFIAEKGIYGRGAVNFRHVMAKQFPGLSPEEAFAKGPEAWLAGGVSEDTARRLFGDEVGVEARRRSLARSNQRKQEKASAAA